MELTSKTLHEVTFGAKVRGYDPAEVDEFIAAVAEGVEELQERLRRATDRAVRAEQQAAALAIAPPAAPEPVVAAVVTPAASSGATEISRVWERAAAAAESAIEEAKAEASQLLDDARQRSEAQLADARREADSAVGGARAEAQRVLEESQVQVRAELTQLETARDRLTTDVDRLSRYLDDERERVRAALSRALVALEENANTPLPRPEVAEVYVPQPVHHDSEASDGGDGSDGGGDAGYSDEHGGGQVAGNGWGHEEAPMRHAEPVGEQDQWAASSYAEQSAHAATENDQHQWAAPEPQQRPAPEPQGWGAPPEPGHHQQQQQGWGAPEPQQHQQQNWGAPEPRQEAPPLSDWDRHTDQHPAPPPADSRRGQGKEEADPFLAELRRAVQDDGPLGPRDSDGGSDDSINSLYADEEDDDKSGFFRRKK